jgi:L-amino acid N-acyltransferase YncA
MRSPPVGFPYLVAHIDGRVLGYAYASHFRTRPAYRFMVEDSIYIAPDAQGQGLGTLLLGELLARCEAHGFRQMMAVIGDCAVNLASARLHAAMGFVECGRIKGSRLQVRTLVRHAADAARIEWRRRHAT